MAAALSDTFEFSALHYTAEELDREVHSYELNELDDIILRINRIQAGVGGDNSWSRIVTHEQYLPCDEEYNYSFMIGAVLPGEDRDETARSWQSKE